MLNDGIVDIIVYLEKSMVISTQYKIEGIWSFLKNIENNIYFIISKENFILFLRKAELQRKINNMSDQQKWTELIDIIKYINN